MQIAWDGFLALLEQYHRPLPTKAELVEAFRAVGSAGSHVYACFVGPCACPRRWIRMEAAVWIARS